MAHRHGFFTGTHERNRALYLSHLNSFIPPYSLSFGRMMLALQVVGLKMTSQIDDPRHIVMRILGNTGAPEPEPHSGMSGGGAMLLSSHLLDHAVENRAFDNVLLDFLALLNVSIAHVPLSPARISSPSTANCQTLLQFATLAKFLFLVRFLLSQRIHMDASDMNNLKF